MARELLILSDLHLGTDRRGGTTPLSAAQLKGYLLSEFNDILERHLDKDLLINGDLFDKFTEDDSTLKATFSILSKWLRKSGGHLYNVFGNHDKSARGDKLSSFDLLTFILQESFPDQVTGFEPELTKIKDGIWVIPHCMNTDLFELEVNKAVKTLDKGDKLFLHANVMNPFADDSDHSLNMTEEMCTNLVDKGVQLLFGHEHQWRCLKLYVEGFKHVQGFDPEADIIVMGNQFPSSVADCLSSKVSQVDGKKYLHIIGQDGTIRREKTWDRSSEFIEVEWAALDLVENQRFIRIVGEIESSEASNLINLISRFRQRSEAFVITNAVQIKGATTIDEFGGVSLEEIKAFDVLEALLAELDEDQQKAVKALLED